VRASADGYTLLLITSTNAINTTLYDELSFDLIRDIAPVASVNRSPGVMEVNPMARRLNRSSRDQYRDKQWMWA